MAPSFPIPVLSVAPDAVRDLDGHEALYGLWTLFTKCKESLQHGRRLENISWRLWHRELMHADRPPVDTSTLHSLEHEHEHELLDEKLSLSHPPLSSSSSTASSSSASSSSSYSATRSPALSHTSLAYRPPTPAESVAVHDPPSYSAHDPQALQGGMGTSMSLQGLNHTDLATSPASSSEAGASALANIANTNVSNINLDTNSINTQTLSYNTAADTQPYSTLPSPLPSPLIPQQSIPQSLPPPTAPTIPHASTTISYASSSNTGTDRSSAASIPTSSEILPLSSATPEPQPQFRPHPPAPAIGYSKSQPVGGRAGDSPGPDFASSSSTPYPHSPFLSSQSHRSANSPCSLQSSLSPSPQPSRPAVARSYTESSVIGVMDANRIRRSSFAGMSVGRIICDMLPISTPGCCPGADVVDSEGAAGWTASAKIVPATSASSHAAFAHPGASSTTMTLGTGVSCLPTPELEEIASRSAVPAPREEEARREREAGGWEEAQRGLGRLFKEEREARMAGGGAERRFEGGLSGGGRLGEGGREGEDGDGVAAFAKHVAHVAGAAASEVASALALEQRQRDAVGVGAAPPTTNGVLGGGTGDDAHAGSGRTDADRGDSDRQDGDKDWDKDRTDRAAFAPAPRGLMGGDIGGGVANVGSDDGAYHVSGERVGPGAAEEERDDYSETSTPTHTHTNPLHTPPHIYQPFQELLEPPRLVVVNPTPNLTPHPTPPSTPIVFPGLPRALAPGPGQWLMPPGQQQLVSARTQIQQYQLQQTQLAKLLPPLTLPPPPQRTTHVQDGDGFGTGFGVGVGMGSVNMAQAGEHAAVQGHVPSSVTGDRAEKSAASAGTAGTAEIAGAAGSAGVAFGVSRMAYPSATAQGSHAGRGQQRHEDAQMLSHSQHAHRSLGAPYSKQQQYPNQQLQMMQQGQGQIEKTHSQPRYAGYQSLSQGYSHAHGRAGADAELAVPAPADFLFTGAGADDVEGVHLLGLLPPAPVNTHSTVIASGSGHTTTTMCKTPTPGPNAPANTNSGIGNVNGSRDNANRRSISSNTSASSHTTTASLQSTRTDSSSATSASARSKATAGEAFETVLADDRSDATFGELLGEGSVQNDGVNSGIGVEVGGGEQSQRRGVDDNNEALEEEEDDPLSPLPTVTTFGGSISPLTVDKPTSRTQKRHSAPPRSTSDSTQMRIALSLSPVSPVPLGDVDAEPAVVDVQEKQQDSKATKASQSALRAAAARSRSASSTRSASKRSSFSASTSKVSRKGSMGPPPPPTMTTTTMTATTASTSAKSASTTQTASSTAVRRSSSTRSTSRTRSTAGSSLGKSRSRSREPGLRLGLGLGMTTTVAQAVAATVAAAVPSTKSTKSTARGKAKFSLGRAGNKKTPAAVAALKRTSSGIVSKAKSKQKEEEQEQEQEEEEEEEEVPEVEIEVEEEEEEHYGRNLRGDGETIDLDDLTKEGAEVQAQTLRMEREERARERMFLQEQARRAARAEEEKERRRMAERQRRQLETIAALTSTATADNVSETSSKRPVRFNIGSNSDDGMGGRSAGSGSEVSGGVSGRSVGEDPRVGGAKGKGKERAISTEQRLAFQQQEYQLQYQQQQNRQAYQQEQQFQPPPNPNHATGQYMQAHRQLSKHQLHQLQIMEQMHQQQQRPTAAQQQAQQYQQQFQNQNFPPQQPQLKQSAKAGHSRHASTADAGDAVENNRTSKKGKQREVAVTPPAEPSAKPKKSNSRMPAAVADAAVVGAMLAAKLQDSLNTPLLPTGKKRVELVSTESEEFETTDDEGEWSSLEMTADDAEAQQAREEEEHNRILLLQIQQQHDRQMQLLQQQQQREQQQRRQQAPRPQAPQRTHSSHYPAPSNARNKQTARAQQRQAQAQAQSRDKAALEAQRQEELFVKLPTSSFQDLAKARTNSVGLLTQLMNPDIEKFPPNHPYRRGFSSGELRRSGISALTPMRMTPTASNSSQPSPSPTPVAVNAEQPPTPAAANPTQTTISAPAPSDAVPPAAPAASSTSRPAMIRRNTADVVASRSAFSPPLRSAGLVLTKSSAALPTATQLQVGSVTTKVAQRTAALLDHVNSHGSSGGSGGYRPRGPPKGQEMEDDSDSDDGIQISSVVQEKLKAYAERVGIKPTTKNLNRDAPGPSNPQAARADDNDVPPWVVSQPHVQHTRSQSHGEPTQRRLPAGLQLTPVDAEDVPPSAATAPIRVDYPYNLPLPVPPSTPRTTRRNMMATELTESLRRNVLWHRHVDKPNAAIRRTSSGGSSRLGELRPLTAVPSMVQLHAKGTKPEGTSQITRHQPLNEQEREAAREQRQLMRNKSWAHDSNDYHYSGW